MAQNEKSKRVAAFEKARAKDRKAIHDHSQKVAARNDTNVITPVSPNAPDRR